VLLRATFAGMIFLQFLLWASPVVAGSDDESAASWLPFSTKESNETRGRLAKQGVEFGLIYVMDNITNVTGGTRRGGIEFGRFDPYLDLDLEKLMGWGEPRFTPTPTVSTAQV
jgi:porin